MIFSHDTTFFHCSILSWVGILWAIIWDVYFRNSESYKSIYTTFSFLCDYIFCTSSSVSFVLFIFSYTVNLKYHTSTHICHCYLHRTRRIAIAQTWANISHSQSRWRHRYNKNHRDLHYRADDLIYVQFCTCRTKLNAPWFEPCTVIQVAAQQKYFVRNDFTTYIA